METESWFTGTMGREKKRRERLKGSGGGAEVYYVRGSGTVKCFLKMLRMVSCARKSLIHHLDDDRPF